MPIKWYILLVKLMFYLNFNKLIFIRKGELMSLGTAFVAFMLLLVLGGFFMGRESKGGSDE